MNEADIYKIPESKNYWLIKTDAGEIYDHFIKFELIAIGHLDVLEAKIKPTKAFYPDISNIKQKLEIANLKLEKSKGHTTSSATQINTFIHKMNVGDWVMAKGNGYVSIGRITSSPFIDKNPCVIREQSPNGEKIRSMDFLLRRAVVWGPKINVEMLPSALKYSLNARQALYSLNKHTIPIHHLIYPYFQTDDDFYMSFRITKKTDINNYSVTKLLLFLNELEVISKTFDEDYNSGEFLEEFNNFVTNNNFELTTKAGFYSQGDIWATLKLATEFASKHKIKANAMLIYIMIFGNSFTGFDGILDLESRQKLWGVVEERLKVNNMDQVIETLELEKPEHDTKIIESKENDENLNIKRIAVNESKEGTKNSEFDF